MKQVTNMSRLTNQLEKTFRLLNADFFNDELPTPVITVTPTAKAYAHYTPFNAWATKDEYRREINIASGTLNRPLENIIASLMHEMCHIYNDCILHIQDTSRGGTYHNKSFATACETHGLNCERVDKYGYCKTEPNDDLILWVLEHDELRDIEMCRIVPTFAAVGTGTHTSSGGVNPTVKPVASHSRKYVCPCCGNSVRATKQVNVVCGDCMETMIEC